MPSSRQGILCRRGPNRHDAELGRTAFALTPPHLRTLQFGVRLRQRRIGRRLLVHGRKRSPADAGPGLWRLPLPRLPARRGEGRQGANRMNLRAMRRAGAFGAALTVLAVATRQAAAADISIIGKWQIVEAAPAPWAAPGD